MKTIIRLAFGLVSSLLISAGLFRAASRLDPLVNVNEQRFNDARTERMAGSCLMPCAYVSRDSLPQTSPRLS